MIHEETCFIATCDNCGEIFSDGEYSMFPLQSDVKDQMNNDSEWYSGITDKDHLGKHYCPECFKYSDEFDDKIILDESRKKEYSSQVSSSVSVPTQPQQGYTREQMMDLAGYMAAADPTRPIHELKEEAEAYIDKLPTPQSQDRWVDVRDKTPDIAKGQDCSENVLAICGGKLMVMCYCYIMAEIGGYVWCNCYGDINADGEFDDQYNVTHWQPLPSPPANKSL